MNTESKDLYNQEVIIVITSDDDEEETMKNKHPQKKECKNKRKKNLDDDKTNKLEIEVNKTKLSCQENETSKNHVQIESCEKEKSYREQYEHSQRKREIEHECIKRYSSLKEPLNTNRDKIVPNCYRCRCDKLIRPKKRHYQEKHNRKMNNRLRYQSRRSQRKRKENSYRKHLDMSKHNNNSLSPVSSVPFGDYIKRRENSYDRVSLDSLPFATDKLDMLIKRTREREKKIQEKLVNIQQALENLTPNNMESEDDCPTTYSSGMNVSIHSMATLVIGPRQSPPRDHLDLPDHTEATMHESHTNKYFMTNSASNDNRLLFNRNDISKRSYNVKTYRANRDIQSRVYSSKYFTREVYQIESHNERYNHPISSSIFNNTEYHNYVSNYSQSRCNMFNGGYEAKVPLNYHYTKSYTSETVTNFYY